MDEKTRFKLAFGEYRIFLSIDYDELFRRAANDRGIIVEWVPPNMKGVKGETRDFLTKNSGIIAGSPNARGAWASRGDEPKQLFMSAFSID
jgi:hypothetical protein